MTGITDPTNATINYVHDSAGRTTSVTGSPYGTGGINGTPYIEISQYATNLQYRAWGGLKSLIYGNNLNLAVGYDSRLRGAEFEVAGRPAQFGPPTVMKAQYQYYQDSSAKYAHDLLDERFDRAFSYDHVGSLKDAYSGSEARDYVNGTNSGTATGPYRQTYQHDAFGSITNRTNRFWSQTDIFTASYANNRRQDPAFHYDAVGNLTQDTDLQYAYDAAGLNTSVVSAAANKTIAPVYDGDGQAVRRVETESGTTSITYYLRSSVLGNVITELNAQGVKLKTYVYLDGQVLALQLPNWIAWQHVNPITGSRGGSNRDGAYSLEAEPDPMGIDVGTFDPFVHLELYEPPPEGTTGLLAGSGVPNGRCVLDGMAIDCGWAMEMKSSGAAVPCPDNDCGPRAIYDPKAQRFVGVLPLSIDPNTGEWIVSGRINQYSRIQTTIGGQVFPPEWRRVGTRQVTLSAAASYSPFLSFIHNATEPQNPDRRLTTEETSALRNRIADLLTDPNCQPFINELLAKTAEQNKDNQPFSTDPMKLFNEIDTRGGYNYNTRYGHSTINSNLRYPNAAVLLLPPSSFGPGSWPGRMEFIANEIAEEALHETLHLAGGNAFYSDEVFAKATLDIAAAHGWKLPSEADRQKILSDRFAASNYWGGILRSKCRPSSERR